MFHNSTEDLKACKTKYSVGALIPFLYMFGIEIIEIVFLRVWELATKARQSSRKFVGLPDIIGKNCLGPVNITTSQDRLSDEILEPKM